jgi:outer membrane receptor for ferrienterochelin and colicin
LVAVGQKVKKQVVRREITVRELATVPGTQGDAVKAVQNLPGVARTNDDTVVMRGIGGAQVFVNGHPVQSAFHFAGLRSTIGNGMIESLEVTPGNYDSRYGGALSGIIDIQTRRPRTDGVHGYGQVDLFDASAFIESGVGDNGALALGARRSYIDGVLGLVLSGEAKETFQTAPRYYDFQGTYDWKAGKNRFRLNAFGARDEIVLLLQEPDEGDPAFRGRLSALSQWFTTQALWDHRMSEDTQLSAGLSYLRGGSEQYLGQDFRLKFSSNIVTWRTDFSHRMAPWVTARAGLDLHFEQIDFDVFLPPPPKEGQPPPSLSTQESLRAEGDAVGFQPAAYAALDLKLGPVMLVPAVRVEHFSRVNEIGGEVIAQPRVDARWAVTPQTAIKGGVGVYTDAPDIDESNEVFGNPDIEPQRATHYSLGVEQRLSRVLSVDVTGFYQDLYHQISPVEDPAIKYDNGGKGRVYGGEFLLKHDPSSRFYGWIAYTLLRSERKDSGDPNYRIYDLDQTHNINIVGQYRLTPRWELGARYRYVSGDPSTPVVDAVYDSDADVYSPVYGRTNSDRNSSFQQLDIRVDRHWTYNTWKLTAYLDIQNVLNRENAEGDPSYNFNYRESKSAAGLPILPSFGLKGEF